MKRRVWIPVICCLLLGVLPQKVQGAALEVAGKSAVLVDAATGTVLYEANAHEPLPPASVTKVMTMLLIMEAIDSGKIRWEDPVTASETAAAKGGSQIFLKAGEIMSVSDLVKSIAVSSANDCACAMAEHLWGSEQAFVEKMNKRAQELGMKDTSFVNCTGLDDAPEAAEHKTSAHDIALMSRQLLRNHPDIKKYTAIWMDTVRDGAFGLANTNKMVRFYSGCTGLKTGYTSGAGYCLAAAAEREGMELIAVVMGSKTSQERFAACKSMLDYGFANFTLYTPPLQEELTVDVVLGKTKKARAVPAENTALLVEKGQLQSLSTEVTLEDTMEAPISKGQRLGTLTVRAGDQVFSRIPLVAETGIPRKGWRDIFVELLRQVAMAKPAA